MLIGSKLDRFLSSFFFITFVSAILKDWDEAESTVSTLNPRL